jgi:hypothetical protein
MLRAGDSGRMTYPTQQHALTKPRNPCGQWRAPHVSHAELGRKEGQRGTKVGCRGPSGDRAGPRERVRRFAPILTRATRLPTDRTGGAGVLPVVARGACQKFQRCALATRKSRNTWIRATDFNSSGYTKYASSASVSASPNSCTNPPFSSTR